MKIQLIVAVICSFVAFGTPASAEILPDPIASCVPADVRSRLDNVRSRLEKAPSDYSAKLWKALVCIVDGSPRVRTKDGDKTLRLYASEEADVAEDIGLGNIGSHWVRLKKDGALEMEGLVWIGGTFQAYCTWTYLNVRESFEGLSGIFRCEKKHTRAQVEMEREHRKEWLSGSFNVILERVLVKAIYMHERRAQPL